MVCELWSWAWGVYFLTQQQNIAASVWLGMKGISNVFMLLHHVGHFVSLRRKQSSVAETVWTGETSVGRTQSMLGALHPLLSTIDHSPSDLNVTLSQRRYRDDVAVLSDISDVFKRALEPIRDILAARDARGSKSSMLADASSSAHSEPRRVCTSDDKAISFEVLALDSLEVDGRVTAFFPGTFRDIRRHRNLDEAFCAMTIKVQSRGP